VLRWWFAHAPAMCRYRSLFRQQLRLRPTELETQYLVFHPAQATPEILAGFLGGIMEGFDGVGLAKQYVRGWVNRFPGGNRL